jgi:hypothetical protein
MVEKVGEGRALCARLVIRAWLAWAMSSYLVVWVRAGGKLTLPFGSLFW